MTYELGDIFKDASLTDIHEYLLENKVTLDGSDTNSVKTLGLPTVLSGCFFKNERLNFEAIFCAL
jgi:hypothetical protein